MKSYVSLAWCEELTQRYLELGGEVAEVEPGCLGMGTTICWGDGLKTAVITEEYLNEWSSGHTVRLYKKMPAKYEKMLSKYYEDGVEEEDEKTNIA